MTLIRLGSRSSALAMYQTHVVADALKAKGYEVEITALETKGDKILHTSLSKIGSKGVFTEELESMLDEGTIDLAIHSAKDLPSHLPQNLELIAFLEREEPYDVVLSTQKDFTLNCKEQKIIGTSSTRRVAFMKKYYPQHSLVSVRGNLQTRLKKLKEGACDALLLAYAGVKRMNFEEYVTERLSVETFTPPAGQGSIAVQANTNLNPSLKKELRSILNHEPTEYALLAERAYLYELEGGCSIPSFAYAYIVNNSMYLHVGLLSLDGSKTLSESSFCDPKEGIMVAKSLAARIMKHGGKTLLSEIRAEL